MSSLEKNPRAKTTVLFSVNPYSLFVHTMSKMLRERMARSRRTMEPFVASLRAGCNILKPTASHSEKLFDFHEDEYRKKKNWGAAGYYYTGVVHPPPASSCFALPCRIFDFFSVAPLLVGIAPTTKTWYTCLLLYHDVVVDPRLCTHKPRTKLAFPLRSTLTYPSHIKTGTFRVNLTYQYMTLSINYC